MNRTCKVCKVIFQTSTMRSFKYCPKCFIQHIEKLFMLAIPHLYELSDEKLIELIGLTNVMHDSAVMENTRRTGYVSALIARVRKS